MANNTLNENIQQAISDLNGVKSSLIEFGVEIPTGTHTSEYEAKIGYAKTGYALEVSTEEEYNSKLIAENINKILCYNGNFYLIKENTDKYSGVAIELEFTEETIVNLTSSSLSNITEINWGDGTTSTEIGSHTYNIGNYTLLLNGSNIVLGGSDLYNVLGVSNTFAKTITCGENVISLDYGAFGGCQGLTCVTLDNTITNIGASVFYNCISLDTIDLTAFSSTNTVPSLNTLYTFYNCPSDFVFLFIDNDTMEHFAETTSWNNYINNMEVV